MAGCKPIVLPACWPIADAPLVGSSSSLPATLACQSEPGRNWRSHYIGGPAKEQTNKPTPECAKAAGQLAQPRRAPLLSKPASLAPQSHLASQPSGFVVVVNSIFSLRAKLCAKSGHTKVTNEAHRAVGRRAVGFARHLRLRIAHLSRLCYSNRILA